MARELLHFTPYAFHIGLICRGSSGLCCGLEERRSRGSSFENPNKRADKSGSAQLEETWARHQPFHCQKLDQATPGRRSSLNCRSRQIVTPNARRVIARDARVRSESLI